MSFFYAFFCCTKWNQKQNKTNPTPKQTQHQTDLKFQIPTFKNQHLLFDKQKNASNQKLTRTHEACQSVNHGSEVLQVFIQYS